MEQSKDIGAVLGYSRFVFLEWDITIFEYNSVKRDLEKRLRSMGKEIVHLGCRSALSDCINFNAIGGIKEDVGLCTMCTWCQSLQGGLVGRIDVESPASSEIVDAQVDREAKGLRDIAMHQFILREKTDVVSIEKEGYFQKIYDAVVAAYKAGLARRNFEDEIYVCVNNNYSLHRAYELGFGKTGISIEPEIYPSSEELCYFLAWGGLRVNQKCISEARISLNKEWTTVKNVAGIYRSLGARIEKGDYNTYRTKEIRASAIDKYQSFSRKYKATIVYLLSSPEEVEANLVSEGREVGSGQNKFGFKKQQDALDFIYRCAEKANDRLFIVRIHPRMLPNKRGSSISEFYLQLKQSKLFASLPNLMLSEEIDLTSYSLARVADIRIASWGTMGLELPASNLACVVLFPEYCCYPVEELTDQPESVEQLTKYLLYGELKGVVDQERVRKTLESLYTTDLISTRTASIRWASWHAPNLGKVILRLWRVSARLGNLAGRYAVLHMKLKEGVSSLLVEIRSRSFYQRLMPKGSNRLNKRRAQE